MSSKAIDVVGELMMHSTNDSVRLAASRLIMEKSGFAQQIEINVTDTSDIMENPGEVVRDRLRRLGKTAASMHAELESAVDAEVVDAEVQDVQDDDDFVPPPYVPGETPQF
jgi:hypothetical protein